MTKITVTKSVRNGIRRVSGLTSEQNREHLMIPKRGVFPVLFIVCLLGATLFIPNEALATEGLGGTCKKHQDCHATLRCNSSKCVNLSGHGSRGNYCNANHQCSPGDPCRNNKCSARGNIKESCNGDGDCKSQYRCNKSKCVYATGQGSKGKYCNDDNQCNPSLRCKSYKCSELGSIKDSCNGDGDCKSQYRCNQSKCVYATGQGNNGNYCNNDNQCNPSLLCKSNKCSERGNIKESCSGDGDCKSQYRCNQSKCVYATGQGSKGKYCNNDNQCNPSLRCKSNKCSELAGIGDSCSGNSDCASGRRCDNYSPHKCIPDDGHGVRDDYCSHNNHCKHGVYYCISNSCATPLKNGKKCDNNGECESGCCNSNKCSSRNQCYLPEDGFCDFFSGGAYSIIRNSAEELKTAAKDAKDLSKQVEKIIAKVKNLVSSIIKQIKQAGAAVAKEAKKSATATLAKGKETIKTTKDKIAGDAKASAKLVADFSKSKGGVCSPTGGLSHEKALARLKKAEQRVKDLNKAAIGLSLQPLEVTKDLIASKIENSVNEHVKVANKTAKISVKLQKDIILESLNLALSAVSNFIDDPIGTIFNPIGTMKELTNQALEVTASHLDKVDVLFNEQVNILREAVIAEVKSNTQEVLKLMDAVQQHHKLSAELVKNMHTVAQTCTNGDAKKLDRTVKRKIKKTPKDIAVPATMTTGSFTELSPAKNAVSKAQKTARKKATTLNNRMTKFAKQKQQAKAQANKTKPDVKKRFDDLFKDKSSAEAKAAKKAFMAEMEQIYGDSPKVKSRIEKELDSEMRKRALSKTGRGKTGRGKTGRDKPGRGKPTRLKR